jgi:membrane protease YdiL (CAAX protease family)
MLTVIAVLLPLPLALVLVDASGVDALGLAGVVAGVLLAWAAMRLRGERWADVGMRRGFGLRRTLAVAVPTAIVLLILTSVLGSLLERFTGWSPDISRFEVLRGNVGALLGGLLIVWTTAAFGEEMLFRGFLLNALCELFSWGKPSGRITWGAALCVSSVAFGAAHAYQGAAGMILTGIVGLGYGLMYLVMGRNLWVAILIHGVYDTVGFLIVFASWDRLLAPSLVWWCQ